MAKMAKKSTIPVVILLLSIKTSSMSSQALSGAAPAFSRGFCDVSTVAFAVPSNQGFQTVDTSQNFYDIPDNLIIDGLINDHQFDHKDSVLPVRPKFEKSVDCKCHFFTAKGGLQTINLGRVSGRVLQNRTPLIGTVLNMGLPTLLEENLQSCSLCTTATNSLKWDSVAGG